MNKGVKDKERESGSSHGSGSASRGGSGSPHNSDRSRPSSNTENQLYNSRSQSTPQSDFARSAHAAARAGLTQPTGPEGRVITENTDMSSLTDAEIVQLMEGMDDDVLNKVGSSMA